MDFRSLLLHIMNFKKCIRIHHNVVAEPPPKKKKSNKVSENGDLSDSRSYLHALAP